jgi:hypothetical protein
MAGPEPPPPPGDPTRPTEPLRPPPPARAPRAPAEPPVVERLPPDYPPEDPWWSNPWAAVATGLLGLLAGAVLGYLVGNSASSTRTVASGPTATHTVTSTRTVQQKPVTVTAKTVTTAPPSPASEQRRIEAEEKARKLEKENEELRRAGEAP